MADNCKYWLSVDLSSPRGTVAIHSINSTALPTLLVSRVITELGEHTEAFIPQLQSVLNETNISFNHISRLITSSGPGSFTGLRIAFASLKALAYGANIPLDVLSGSEARALSWVIKQSELSHENLYVTTYITSARFVAAHFKVNKDKSLTFTEEKICSNGSFINCKSSPVVLLDGRINSAKIQSEYPFFSYEYPLDAAQLGETLLLAHTRNSYQSFDDWRFLSPRYFGSDRY